jgi:hypothetical protein
LSVYDLQITHTKSKKNDVTDTLSRAPQFNGGSRKLNLQLLKIQDETLVSAQRTSLIVKNYSFVEKKEILSKVFKIEESYHY